MNKQFGYLMILGFLFLSACATNSVSTGGSAVMDNLPRKYHGTFRWKSEQSIQIMSIAISEVFVDLEKNIMATGTGRYDTPDGGTNIDIKIKIVPDSLRFEMWEMDPKGTSDFITDGSHVGTISNDLRTIEAVWTTSGSGQQGDLMLQAD